MARLWRQPRPIEDPAILRAAVDVLGRHALDAWTTHHIAKRLGLSRFQLFRRFGGRQALVVAALEQIRTELGVLATQIVEAEVPSRERLRNLVDRLLGYFEDRPGVLGLLLLAAEDPDPKISVLARQIHSMQRNLVAALAGELGPEEEMSPKHDDRERTPAAQGLLALIHGEVLACSLSGDRRSFRDAAARVWAAWWAGPRSLSDGPKDSASTWDAHGPGPNHETHGRDPTGPEEAQSARANPLVALDVRPLLAQGHDPLAAILARLARVPSAGVLEIAAPFRPLPLIALMKQRGHAVIVRSSNLGVDSDDQIHLVDIVVGGSPEIEDLSDLPAPEPLVRVLEVAATLEPSATYLARVPRRPELLLAKLRERGLAHALLESPDGTALLQLQA